MRELEFSLFASEFDPDNFTDEFSGLVLAQVPDLSGLGYVNGELIIDIVQKVDSFQDAIATAIHDVEQIDGIHIDRIEIHDGSEPEFLEGQEIVNSIMRLRRLTQKQCVDQFWGLIDTA